MSSITDFKKHLLELLVSEHSKKMSERIAREIGDNPAYFKNLIELILESEYRIVQRAAWPMAFVCEKHPELIKPYIHQLAQKLFEPAHDALHRNIVRVFQYVEIPKREQGLLADACFQFLYNKETPIAIKAFSMTVLNNICKQEPELAQELCLYIEERMPFESAAFKSRGKKILAYWRKRNIN